MILADDNPSDPNALASSSPRESLDRFANAGRRVSQVQASCKITCTPQTVTSSRNVWSLTPRAGRRHGPHPLAGMLREDSGDSARASRHAAERRIQEVRRLEEIEDGLSCWGYALTLGRMLAVGVCITNLVLQAWLMSTTSSERLFDELWADAAAFAFGTLAISVAIMVLVVVFTALLSHAGEIVLIAKQCLMPARRVFVEARPLSARERPSTTLGGGLFSARGSVSTPSRGAPKQHGLSASTLDVSVTDGTFRARPARSSRRHLLALVLEIVNEDRVHHTYWVLRSGIRTGWAIVYLWCRRPPHPLAPLPRHTHHLGAFPPPGVVRRPRPPHSRPCAPGTSPACAASRASAPTPPRRTASTGTLRSSARPCTPWTRCCSGRSTCSCSCAAEGVQPPRTPHTPRAAPLRGLRRS